MKSNTNTSKSKMLQILTSSFLLQEDNIDEINEEREDKKSQMKATSASSTSILNYITASMNNTFLNSADIRIADKNQNIINDVTRVEITDITDRSLNYITSSSSSSSLSSASLTYQSSSTEQTKIFEKILKEVDKKIDSINNNNNINDSIESIFSSTINYGYSTVLNLMNSLEATTSFPIDITKDFSQNNYNNLSDIITTTTKATETSSFNEIVNLNRSYYHHLPPSLLSGHQFTVGIGSYDSQLNNLNSIDNENDVSIMSSSTSNTGIGVVLGSYINSTIVNNFSDFLLNNNSTDEKYLIKLNDNNNSYNNDSDDSEEFFAPGAKRDFVFDRTDVKIIFITLYSLVFCCCFFGNLLVILVVTLSRRLRSITNFFLANLAVADFCVGVFCVMQNLTIYLIDSWVFGKFLCKMYQFVHSLSYTASIFILVVICMERYFAIIHPITCKQILTPSRLRLVILGVWITSAVYSTPKFIFSKTITNIHTINGIEENICILDRQMFNSELLDLINFGFLYVTPLLVMTILYSRIAIALWKSSRGLERHIALQNTSTCSPSYSGAHLYRKPSSMRSGIGVTESQVSIEADKVVVTTWKKTNNFHQRHGTQVAQMSNSTNNVLRARRGVIRMLIIVVLTFALCNLPYHARKMWMYWSDTYKGYSNFNALFTPLTFLATYFNSGVNPLLYAFLSRNFRKGMRELLLCSFKKSKNKSSSLHQRVPLQEVASVVMQAVNLPLEKLNENCDSSGSTVNENKSLHNEDSMNREQHTEIITTEGI